MGWLHKSKQSVNETLGGTVDSRKCLMVLAFGGGKNQNIAALLIIFTITAFNSGSVMHFYVLPTVNPTLHECMKMYVFEGMADDRLSLKQLIS